MDEADEGSDVLHLVRLEVSDEVPLDVFRQRLVLLYQLLYMALTEDALPTIVCLLYHLDWMVLAHGHQPYAFGQRLFDTVYSFNYHLRRL